MTHFGLYLSDMRVGHFEESDRLVAHATHREDLLALLQREKVPAYDDPKGDGTVWIKTFRKGGPLEWCNDVRASPPMAMAFGFFVMLEVGGDRRIEQIYTLEEYVKKHRRDYQHLLGQAYDADVIDGTVVEHLALTSGEGQEHEDEKDEDREAADGHAEEDDRHDDVQEQDDA